MKRSGLILGLLLSFASGVAVGPWCWRAATDLSRRWNKPAPIPPGEPLSAIMNWDGNATSPLTDLGIRVGDLLLSVNGVRDHHMFEEMNRGLERGDVCVTFERAGVTRETCVRRPMVK